MSSSPRKLNLLCQLLALLWFVRMTLIYIIKLWQELPAIPGYLNLGLDLRETGPKGSCLLMLSFDERFEQVQVTQHRQGFSR